MAISMRTTSIYLQVSSSTPYSGPIYVWGKDLLSISYSYKGMITAGSGSIYAGQITKSSNGATITCPLLFCDSAENPTISSNFTITSIETTNLIGADQDFINSFTLSDIGYPPTSRETKTATLNVSVNFTNLYKTTLVPTTISFMQEYYVWGSSEESSTKYYMGVLSKDSQVVFAANSSTSSISPTYFWISSSSESYVAITDTTIKAVSAGTITTDKKGFYYTISSDQTINIDFNALWVGLESTNGKWYNENEEVVTFTNAWAGASWTRTDNVLKILTAPDTYSTFTYVANSLQYHTANTFYEPFDTAGTITADQKTFTATTSFVRQATSLSWNKTSDKVTSLTLTYKTRVEVDTTVTKTEAFSVSAGKGFSYSWTATYAADYTGPVSGSGFCSTETEVIAPIATSDLSVYKIKETSVIDIFEIVKERQAASNFTKLNNFIIRNNSTNTLGNYLYAGAQDWNNVQTILGYKDEGEDTAAIMKGYLPLDFTYTAKEDTASASEEGFEISSTNNNTILIASGVNPGGKMEEFMFQIIRHSDPDYLYVYGTYHSYKVQRIKGIDGNYHNTVATFEKLGYVPKVITLLLGAGGGCGGQTAVLKIQGSGGGASGASIGVVLSFSSDAVNYKIWVGFYGCLVDTTVTHSGGDSKIVEYLNDTEIQTITVPGGKSGYYTKGGAASSWTPTITGTNIYLIKHWNGCAGGDMDKNGTGFAEAPSFGNIFTEATKSSIIPAGGTKGSGIIYAAGGGGASIAYSGGSSSYGKYGSGGAGLSMGSSSVVGGKGGGRGWYIITY